MKRKPMPDGGSVLLTLLMWMGGIVIMVATLLLVSIKVVRTESLYTQQRQAYWLARGEARRLVQVWALAPPTTLSWTEQYPFGSIEVELALTHTWSGKIVATVENASDTLTFSYSPDSHKIVEWKDNGSN